MPHKFITADSGKRQNFDTGAVRDTQDGKGRFDLQTPIGARRRANVYERGAVKYAARNWEQGMPWSRFLDSAVRHLNDYAEICMYKRFGIPLDRLPSVVNPNEDHLAQAAWNIDSLMTMEELRPDLNDLTQPMAKSKKKRNK